jgi:polyisoprenoid-binding protein YceI
MMIVRDFRDHASCRRLSSVACIAALVSLGISAFAQKAPPPIEINLDPATTAIHWTLNATAHTVHGTFKLKSGSFRIDPVTGEASGQIVVDATSGESGDSTRDKRMHSVVLQSPQYPTITFKPSRVVGKVDLTAAGTVTVDGVLNLHGQDHPMQITVNLHLQAANVALATHFIVPFVAWGLKDPSVAFFRTEKEVALDVEAIAIPANSAARPILRPSEMHSAQ